MPATISLTAPRVPELRYNIYGFNVGGQVPVHENHPTFFFYNMEWRKEIDGGTLTSSFRWQAHIPTANGDVLPSTLTARPDRHDPCHAVVQDQFESRIASGGSAGTGWARCAQASARSPTTPFRRA